MDLAYDHITQSTLTPTSTDPSRSTTPTPTSSSNTADPTSTTNLSDSPSSPRRQNLQEEFAETYSRFQSSAWGSKVGSLWGSAGGLWGNAGNVLDNVRAQGQTYLEEARRTGEKYAEEARKEVGELRDDVVKEMEGLKLGEKLGWANEVDGGEKGDVGRDGEEEEEMGEGLQKGEKGGDIVVEDFLQKFRGEAAKALKEVQKAEDAADEALLRFGSNIRNFLRDAVKVAPPTEDDEGKKQAGGVLFESRDNAGKRVIHTSRLDAQLHVLHTSDAPYLEDQQGTEGKWEEWKGSFDSGSEEMTARIKADLDRFPELRRRMEVLVPEKVEYGVFWARYYFVRKGLEEQEVRRREMLKASADETEEVGWDDDEEDEKSDRSTPQILEPRAEDAESLQESSPVGGVGQHDGLKPEGRRSHDEKSVADSDASYDLVSGAQSRAPNSPKEEKAKEMGKIEESDEEDWE